MEDAHDWVENMTKGELFLNPWAAPAVRSAAPIDLNNMAVMWKYPVGEIYPVPEAFKSNVQTSSPY
jgi:hypothetical protein